MLAVVAIYRVEVARGIRGDTVSKPVFCLLTLQNKKEETF